MEILRILKTGIFMNFKAWLVPLVLLSTLFLSSCSKKPDELYNDGMKLFIAGDYEKAQKYFSDGIKKNGGENLYAGFIAANLVTGKYPQVNSAYNQFTDGIHGALLRLYGSRVLKMYGITSEIIPYNTSGGNRIPSDFPQTITIQAAADYQGYLAVKQQIDSAVKK